MKIKICYQRSVAMSKKVSSRVKAEIFLFFWMIALVNLLVANEDYSKIYEKTYRAVIGIFAKKGMVEYFGTGFFIHPAGYILTTSTTVPKEPESIKIFTSNNRIYNAEWIATDDFLEVSIIKVKMERKKVWRSLVLDDSNKVNVGDECLTFTNDFNSIIEHSQVSMSAGTVSGVYTVEPIKGQRYESKYEGPVFETTAAVNPGSDGGPLVGLNGKVIGVISLAYAQERYLGVAIPINRIKKFIKKHLAKELYGIPVTADVASFNIGWKLKMGKLENTDKSFIQIAEIENGSPIQAAGLQPGDYIIEFDLFKPKSIDVLEKALQLYDYKDVVEIKVLRGEEIKTLYLTLQPKYEK